MKDEYRCPACGGTYWKTVRTSTCPVAPACCYWRRMEPTGFVRYERGESDHQESFAPYNLPVQIEILTRIENALTAKI